MKKCFGSRGFLYKSSAFLMSAVLMFSTLCLTANAEEVKQGDAPEQDIVVTGDSYFEKYASLSKLPKSEQEIILNYSSGKAVNNGKTQAVGEVTGIVLDKDNAWCEWTFEVAEAGTFGLEAEYSPLTDKETDIIASVSIDGKVPFTEADSLYLPRIWGNVYEDVKEGERPFPKDARGNEVTPDRVQKSEWNKKYFYDVQGLYEEPFMFYFEAGTHTIRFTIKDSAIVLAGLKLYNAAYTSYEEYYKEHASSAIKDGDITYLQAELLETTSSASINATYDKLNVATVPSDPQYVIRNTVGAGNWSAQGDAISWKANVPKAGMYRIAFRARQNVNSGLISFRDLYVNGEVPFKEALGIPFAYSQKWEIYTLGGDDEKLVYLEPGDIITLSCSAGQTTGVIRNIQTAVSELNAKYREVIAITSVNPDSFMDYKIEKRLPNLEHELADIKELLEETYDELTEILGNDGSLASTIKVAVQTLEELSEKPYIIPERLSTFKSNIESLGTLINSLGSQPLELDYIAFLPEKAELPKANSNIFKSFGFGFMQFIYSFSTDYNNDPLTGGDGDSINVWVSTGRDQQQVLDSLIMADFSVKTGINVNLNMVDTGTTLIRASLAGKGPDVALMMPQGTPVELAARGALVELSQYMTDDVYNQFHESAWTPLYYQNKLYGLPETQTFSVLFYRTDIFEELGIEVPNTWDEFYEVMAVIQSKNLTVGIPEINSSELGVSASSGIFSALLHQKGQKNFFTEDLSKTCFDTEIAYEAFTQWSELYTDYSIDRSIDVYTRFRSGEVPLAITSFATYVQLQFAAPEIRGLWEMAPMLGMKDENGNIDRSQGGAITGCIMLKAAEEHGVADECYEFMKWWVSAETQANYGSDLENTLGGVGRYFTANQVALKESKWSSEEYELISGQFQYLVNQPTVIGSYAVSRDLTSAVREVIGGTNRPRRALMLYNTDINEEIARKRKEFGLES